MTDQCYRKGFSMGNFFQRLRSSKLGEYSWDPVSRRKRAFWSVTK